MKVKFKRSNIAGKAPKTTDIEVGELALNTKDGKLFTNIGSAIKEIGGSANVVTSSADATAKEVRISEIVSIAQADYDALATKQADKLYIIVG